MYENKKVTIITATYNLVENKRVDSFRQCVESVHNQSYKNIEHLVVDGDSKDGTLEIIKEYAEKGWIKYISKPDNGLYHAMNRGIKLATGDYINFLNSDDFFSDIRGVEKTVDALETNHADFAYSEVTLFDEKNNTMRVAKCRVKDFFARMPFCHQSLFVKKELFDELGMFDREYALAADYDFIMKLILEKKKGVKVPLNFVVFRLGGISTLRESESYEEMIKCIYNNLSKYTLLSDADCEKIFYNRALPYKLWHKVGVGSTFEINKEYLSRKLDLLRRNIIDFRTGDNKKLILFGFNIIGEKKKLL